MESLVAEATAVARVLLLADKDEEIALVKSAAGTHTVQIERTCPDILEYLRDVAERPQPFRPDLILLDLDLANDAHCDTLRTIKEDVRLRRIPVIVLAELESAKAVKDAYNLRANACVVKPKEPGSFVGMVETTLSFWLGITRLS
jgi:two-component system, chemotaxis family, response regulator Rcp1